MPSPEQLLLIADQARDPAGCERVHLGLADYQADGTLAGVVWLWLALLGSSRERANMRAVGERHALVGMLDACILEMKNRGAVTV